MLENNIGVVTEKKPHKHSESTLLSAVRTALETGDYVILPHARQRWSYGFEGKTVDGDELRVVVVLLEQLGIVTVVRLGGDYEKEFGSV
jgi:hypothetical protein